MDSDEKLFWVLLTIFGALFATGPFIFFQSIGWGTFYTLLGLGGLVMLIRDRLTQLRDKAQGVKRVPHNRRIDFQLPIRTSLMIIAAAGISLLFGQSVSMVFGIRSDINKYVMPRIVTAEQADKLKDYLSKHDAYAVSVEVVQNDQEAAEYAAELFNALRQTNWDVNPPNHDGPHSIHIRRLPQPQMNDVGKDGKSLYHNLSDYVTANNAWLESEIDRTVAERTWPDAGLSIQVEIVGQGANPDSRHPAPDAILQDAFRYAEIEVNGGGGSANTGHYSVSLRIGHRPLQLGSNFKQSVFFRIGRWIMDLGR